MGTLLTMPKAVEDYHTRGSNEKRRPGSDRSAVSHFSQEFS
jgi:hypothetical protein